MPTLLVSKSSTVPPDCEAIYSGFAPVGYTCADVWQGFSKASTHQLLLNCLLLNSTKGVSLCKALASVGIQPYAELLRPSHLIMCDNILGEVQWEKQSPIRTLLTTHILTPDNLDGRGHSILVKKMNVVSDYPCNLSSGKRTTI